MGLTKAERKTHDCGKPKRVQTMFRLWSTDRRKIMKKLIDDDLALQQVMEHLCLAYMRDDPAVMGMLREKCLPGHHAKQGRAYIGMAYDDVAEILNRLEKDSPLKDKDIVYNK